MMGHDMGFLADMLGGCVVSILFSTCVCAPALLVTITALMSSPSNTTIVLISSTPQSYTEYIQSTLAVWSPPSCAQLWRWAAIVLLLSVSGSAVHRYLVRRSIQKKLAAMKQIKAQQRAADLASISQHIFGTPLTQVSEHEKKILGCTATQLVNRIRAKEAGFTCQAVVIAFIRQAVRVQQKTNCLSETCFTSAITESKALDQQQSTHRGRLYGLPISLKDSIVVAGLDSTLGLVCYANQPFEKDSLTVELLRREGAQIYTKTNIPQTLISFECSNPLFGKTVHLQNAAYAPGGSSGGESALITGGGSVLGIGTDIGGSVRIPAHFSGHYALKCTSRRMSIQGFRPAVPGQETIPGVPGIMSNNVDDIVLLLDTLLTPAAWTRDSDLVPLPLNRAVLNDTRPLTIGYYTDDGFLPPSPACARAVTETITELTAAGHRCVPFTPPRMLDAIALYYSLMSADGGKTMTGQLTQEEWEDYVTALSTAITIPVPIKFLVSRLLASRLFKGDINAATLFSAVRVRSVTQLWRLQHQKKLYKTEFFAQWQQLGLDAVVCPAHVLPAVKHGAYKAISFTCSFTLLYNILDAPAGICPVTAVRPSDTYSSAESPRGLLEKAARKFYDPVDSAGLPVAVQVAARPYEDEMVLRCMKEIERVKPYSRPVVEW